MAVAVDHQGFIGPRFVSRLFRQYLAEQVHRFDVTPRPADIGRAGDTDAAVGGLVFRCFLGLGKHENGGLQVVRPNKIALRDTTRHLHVNESFVNLVQRYQLPKSLQDCVL